ncbi:hypothetical protein [Achromobacter pestifer]
MQIQRPISCQALPDDPNRVADHGYLRREAAARTPEIQDEQVIGVLCDLFAGRTPTAFGQGLAWWTEALQCDLDPKAAAGVALVALSKWPFDHRAGAAGVNALQDQLLQRARLLIARCDVATQGAD